MEKEKKTLKQKTIAGVFWRFGERITAQLITFVVSIVLARLIAPKEYGVIALTTIFINIVNVLATNGLGTSLVQKKDSDEKDFSTMFHASLVLSIVLYIIIFFGAPLVAKIYHKEVLTVLVRVMGLRVPIAAINSIQQAYVQKKMIYKKFFISTLFGTIVSAFVGIYMAIKGYGVWALVGQYLTNTVIDTIVLCFVIDWKPKLYFSYKRFKELFSFGWKIMLSSFIGTIFGQLKGMVIGKRYTSADLAFYNKADQMPSLINNNVNLTVESVFFPTLSQLQEDPEKVKNAIRKMLRMSSYIMSACLFGLAAVAKPLILILLTKKWIACVPFVQIFCLQYSFSVLGGVNLQALKGIGKSDVILKLEFIKKPLFLLMIIITMMISPFAIAIGGLIYDIVASLINTIPNKKYLNYSLKEQLSDIIPNILMAGTMFAIVYAISLFDLNNYLLLVIQVTVGIIYYIAISKIVKNDSFFEILSFIKSKLRRNS